jgi:hypothetical protein
VQCDQKAQSAEGRRKHGRVVKEGDDLMAATRYALMMMRFARTETQYRNFHRPLLNELPRISVA